MHLAIREDGKDDGPCPFCLAPLIHAGVICHDGVEDEWCMLDWDGYVISLSAYEAQRIVCAECRHELWNRRCRDTAG